MDGLRRTREVWVSMRKRKQESRKAVKEKRDRQRAMKALLCGTKLLRDKFFYSCLHNVWDDRN